MTGMRFTPKGYGGHRRGPDEVKRDGWREQGVLAVAIDDHRLTWPERELVDLEGGRRARAMRWMIFGQQSAAMQHLVPSDAAGPTS